MRAGRTLAKVGLFVAAIAFTGLFFINYCDFLYQCGCTFLWAGAAMECNIHNPHPPHCPWCVNTTAAGGALAFTVFAQAAVAFWPGPLNRMRALGVFVVSPAAAGAAGIAIGLATGYWTA